MIKSLIGHTGFVGSNLTEQTNFNFLYNSSNINEINGREFDLLIIAAPSAIKWKANQEPEKDLGMINNLINSLKKAKAKQVVQISTIDIYKTPSDIDENTTIETEGLHPYGKNRFYLEEFIRQQFKNHLIIRLPALFGEGLKKNFIYDFLNPIPQILSKNKFNDLYKRDKKILNYYKEDSSGNYINSSTNNKQLKIILKRLEFSSMNFTDSRSIFQFYNLEHLWDHIQIAIRNKIKTLNLATEPVSISELYTYLTNSSFTNETTNSPPKYNFKTKYFKTFDGQNGYIYNKKTILEEIKKFIKNHSEEASQH